MEGLQVESLISAISGFPLAEYVAGIATAATLALAQSGKAIFRWRRPEVNKISILARACRLEEVGDDNPIKEFLYHDGYEFKNVVIFEFINNSEQVLYLSFCSFRPDKIAKHLHKNCSRTTFPKKGCFDLKFGPGSVERGKFEYDTLLRPSNRKYAVLALNEDYDFTNLDGLGTVFIEISTRSSFGLYKFSV